MTEELKKQAVKIINEHILTPVIYMLEEGQCAEFVCFCDMNIDAEEFARAEERLFELFGADTAVFDIREYCEADRMEIIENGELIYTASPIFEKLFAMSMAEDFHRSLVERSELLKRYDTSGSVYLQ